MPRINHIVRKKGKQVIHALYKYGPMTISTMEKVIRPKIGRRSLQMIAKRLNENGLVYKRHGSTYNYTVAYHQLNGDNLSIPILSKLLNVNPNEFEIPYSRNQELEHIQTCVLWCEYFERTLPGVKVKRDFRMYNDPSVQELIKMRDKQIDSLPDLLLNIPIPGNKLGVNIAVEIEKTSKKRSRIYDKLHSFAMESRLDGVLYVCKDRRVVNAVCDIYQSRITQKSPRIRHFSNSFMMFCDESAILREKQIVYGLGKQSVELKNWVHFMASTEVQKRPEINVWLLSQVRKY